MEPKEIDILLAKHFNGHLSEVDRKLVQKWIDANSAEYLALKNLVALSETEHLEIEFDVEHGWNKVDSGIKAAKQASIPERIQFVRRKTWWIAASAILILSIAVLYHSFFYNKMIILTAAKTTEFLLPDGSTATLNGGSTLSYEPNRYTSTRRLKLKGEAFFQVVPNPSKPFLVHSALGVAKVLGTSFNVIANTDSMEVAVKTGKVGFHMFGNRDTITLAKGEKASINKYNFFRHGKYAENEYSWRTGRLTFKNEEFHEVLRLLGRSFHLKIILKEKLARCKVTATFRDQSIEDILKELNELFPMEYEITKEHIMIKEINCQGE